MSGAEVVGEGENANWHPGESMSQLNPEPAPATIEPAPPITPEASAETPDPEQEEIMKRITSVERLKKESNTLPDDTTRVKFMRTKFDETIAELKTHLPPQSAVLLQAQTAEVQTAEAAAQAAVTAAEQPNLDQAERPAQTVEQALQVLRDEIAKLPVGEQQTNANNLLTRLQEENQVQQEQQETQAEAESSKVKRALKEAGDTLKNAGYNHQVVDDMIDQVEKSITENTADAPAEKTESSIKDKLMSKVTGLPEGIFGNLLRAYTFLVKEAAATK